jgi:hypothetical protein
MNLQVDNPLQTIEHARWYVAYRARHDGDNTQELVGSWARDFWLRVRPSSLVDYWKVDSSRIWLTNDDNNIRYDMRCELRGDALRDLSAPLGDPRLSGLCVLLRLLRNPGTAQQSLDELDKDVVFDLVFRVSDISGEVVSEMVALAATRLGLGDLVVSINAHLEYCLTDAEYLEMARWLQQQPRRERT